MSLDNPSGGGDGLTPAGPTIQNTYVVDPRFARYFTAGWTGLFVVFVVLAAPTLYRSLRTRRAWQGVGFWESVDGYQPVNEKDSASRRPAVSRPSSASRAVGRARAILISPALFTIPKTDFDIGKLLLFLVYCGILLACLLVQSELKINSNRAGFLALAQLPVVFLFGTKNSPASLLLGKGYEKLNILHRWSGRGIWLMATVHGSIWLNQYSRNGLSYYLSTPKLRLGMAAYGTLCMMVLLSLRPVRARFYTVFFVSHVLSFVAFFVIICYHTPYARPWIYAPVAFYATDLTLRLFRYRLKDAVLESHSTQMTFIHIPHVTGGWVAGQHVNLRIFFGTRFFESHPLTIANAPSSTSALGDAHSGGITLAARASGDWTRAVNAFAQNGEKSDGREYVSVMLDGPYGGSTLDFGGFESVLLVAGGSGITFTLGLLDDLVGRVVRLGRPNGERTRRITFAWYIRSFGAIAWFERYFMAIGKLVEQEGGSAGLELEFRFFVTCLCDPEAVPPIPNSSVEVTKPAISELLAPLLEVARSAGTAGGVGVAASGPGDLARSTQNAVARVGPSLAAFVGGVQLHTEIFTL